MSLNSLSPDPSVSITGDRRKIVKQIAAILFAGLLIWLAFRGANLSAVFAYARHAKILYIGLLCLSVLLSHLLRAWRWLILLRPIATKPVSLWHSFSAIIYGYAANIIIPRGGEIVRLLSICKTEGLPWAGVLPTLLIDRLLDLVMLAFLLGFTLLNLPPAQLSALPWLSPCGISLIVSTVSLFLLLPVLKPVGFFVLNWRWLKQLMPVSIFNKIKNLLDQFDLGTGSLKNPITYPLIVSFSVGVWFCYWLNFHFVLYAFSLEQKLSLSCELIAFTIASVGALVPTPGCIGGFHFFVSKALVLMGGIDQNLALAYATVLHAFAFVIVVSALAAFCFLWQSFGSRDKNETSDR